MYLFEVTWKVMSPYTQKMETGHDFYIAKNEKEVNEFKRQRLINAGCTQISIHSKYIYCFVLIEGLVTSISELARISGLSLEEEFEEITEQVGLHDDK